MPLEASSHGNSGKNNICILNVCAKALTVPLCQSKQLGKRGPVYLGLNNVEFDFRQNLRTSFDLGSFGRNVDVAYSGV